MVATESLSLLRTVRTPQEIANGFVQFCKAKGISTRGYARIGTTTRGLRGVIAAKDIPKDENVIVVPSRSCLSIATVIKDKSFLASLPRDVSHLVETDATLLHGKVGLSGLRQSQLMMAFYMSFVCLKNEPQAHNQLLAYFDFLPRHEGYFPDLQNSLNYALDQSPLCRGSQEALAAMYGVSPAEVRQLLLWCLAMQFSRQVPIEHKQTLQKVFVGTQFEHSFDKEEAFVSSPVPMLCPMLDMCNHSSYENVAIMVAGEQSGALSSGSHICVRSVREIPKGEEITMTYGANPEELRVLWGMAKVIP